MFSFSVILSKVVVRSVIVPIQPLLGDSRRIQCGDPLVDSFFGNMPHYQEGDLGTRFACSEKSLVAVIEPTALVVLVEILL